MLIWPTMRSKSPTAGFSLIELLVSMLLAVTLYAVLVGPSAAQVRKKHLADCAENLRKIHFTLGIYGNDHNGAYPPAAGATNSEQALSVLVPKSTSDTRFFICPATGRDPLPQGRPFAERRISYAYAAGLSRSDAPAVPLLSDAHKGTAPGKRRVFSTDGKGAGNNHGEHGGNVLFNDGHIEQIAAQSEIDLTLPAQAVWLNPKP